MADTTTTQTEPIATVAPLFQPFTWGREQSNFVDDVRDIACGLQHVLEMVEQTVISLDNGGERPLLSPTVCGSLLRFAVTSAKLLADAAAEHADRV